MGGKFNFPLNTMDATARKFRDLQEQIDALRTAVNNLGGTVSLSYSAGDTLDVPSAMTVGEVADGSVSFTIPVSGKVGDVSASADELSATIDGVQVSDLALSVDGGTVTGSGTVNVSDGNVVVNITGSIRFEETNK